MVVSIGKTIVISKRMRVSNQWVVINKGAVSLTMSSNTAVVVSIGISLGIGISISISFSLTTLTSKIHKGGNLMTMMNDRGSSVGYWSNMVSNRSSSREVKTSVEEQLRSSLSLTLMKT